MDLGNLRQLDERFQIDSLNYHEIKIDFTTIYSDKVFSNITTLIIVKILKIIDISTDKTKAYLDIVKMCKDIRKIVKSLLNQIKLNISE